MSGHTPGPWFWIHDARGTAMARLSSATGDVCDFGDERNYYPNEGSEPSHHDSLLIAAAPDLLDELIALRGACAAAGWLTDPDHIDHMDNSRAAIARATGVQS